MLNTRETTQKLTASLPKRFQPSNIIIIDTNVPDAAEERALSRSEKNGCLDLCTCVCCTAGLIVGFVTWPLVIWPAMGRNAVLKGLGQWLMTFLGPGESYIAAFMGAGALVGVCLACCLLALNSSGDKNSHDKALNDLLKNFPQMASFINQLRALEKTGQFNYSVPEAAKVETLLNLFLTNNIITAEQSAELKPHLETVFNHQMNAAELEQMKTQLANISAQLPVILEIINKRSAPVMTNNNSQFFQPASNPKSTVIIEEVKDDENDNTQGMSLSQV